jgi:mRNA interferase RelE/StbE
VHDVLLEGAAQRDLKRLPAEEFARVVSRIRALASNPRPAGSRKLTGSQSDWRIRIGDYRGYHAVYRYPLTEGPSLTVADVLNSRENIEPAIDYIRQELS